MSMFGFFIRFTLVYTVVMVAAGVLMALLDVEKASILNTPILLGVSYWCFYSYSLKNSRVIAGGEKWLLILLALAGDVLSSALLGVPAMLAEDVPIKYLLIGMAVIIPLHLLLFLAVNFGVKKLMLKQYPDLATQHPGTM